MSGRAFGVMEHELTPLTVDQLRAAMHPDDWDDHCITARDVELVGMTCRHPTAKARFFAWMSANRWSVIGEAAGNIHWARSGEHVWLCDMVEDAVTDLIKCMRGEGDLLPQHGHMNGDEGRPALEILAEIVATVPTGAAADEAGRRDGGGALLVTVDRGVLMDMRTDSWSGDEPSSRWNRVQP